MFGGKMRKKMLLKLAKFLREEVPVEDFFIGTWATTKVADGDLPHRHPKPGECGTVGCAIGWATVCFPRSRLRLRYPKSRISDGYITTADIIYKCSDGTELMDFPAAAKAFGISYSAACWLFMPGCYNMPMASVTPQMVANRIERLVENKGQPPDWATTNQRLARISR